MAFGDVIHEAASPSTYPSGIGGDLSKIWHCDKDADKIYELNTSDLGEVRNAASPSTSPRGIGGDASKIWHCDSDADKVYELSTTDFSNVREAVSPSGAPSGIGGDSSKIWHCDAAAGKAYELSTTDLSEVMSATTPSYSPYGIGGDSGTIWHCDLIDKVYELSTSDLSQVREAASPYTSPYGIGGNASKIWHCDRDADKVYELAIPPLEETPTANVRATAPIVLGQVLHVPTVAEARVADLITSTQIFRLSQIAEARAEVPPAYGWGFEQLAEARATNLITPAQLLHFPAAAMAKATESIALRQILHFPATAEAKATDLVFPYQALHLRLLAEARATDLFSPRHILYTYQTAEARARGILKPLEWIVSLIADARATDLITPRQVLHLYLPTEAKVDSLLEPLGWLVLLQTEARAEGIIALRQVLYVPIAAEARATDLVSLSQLLHLYLSAEARATDLVSPAQLLHLYPLVGARAADLVAPGQLLHIYKTVGAKATDLISLGWKEEERAEVKVPTWRYPGIEGWERRKKQTITGTTAGAQTNYQMKMIVHKGSGTDSATNVYCGENCRDDFGDIRWTKDDGTTLMDYWIESIENGYRISSFSFDSRLSDMDAHQGVASDGTYLYNSSGNIGGVPGGDLYKRQKNGTLVDSRTNCHLDGTDMKQINSIHVYGDYLYVGANNYPDTPGKGYIKVYRRDNLNYVEEHQVKDLWCEGCAFHDNAWWVVYCSNTDAGAKIVSKYDTNWNHVADYNLTYSQSTWFGFQGIVWVGDYIYVNAHAGAGSPKCDVYKWNGSGFDEVARLDRPTAQCTQGLCKEPNEDIMWWAERDNPSGTHNIVKSNISFTDRKAIFWVEIPSIPTGAGTVDCYMYYDKSDETSLSDGEDTFVWFDDFAGAHTLGDYDTEDVGDTDTPSDWEIDTSAKILYQHSNIHYTGAGDYNFGSILKPKGVSIDNVAIHFKCKPVDNDTWGCVFSYTNNQACYFFYSTKDFAYKTRPHNLGMLVRQDSGSHNNMDQSTGLNPASVHTIEIRKFGSALSVLKEGAAWLSATDATYGAGRIGLMTNGCLEAEFRPPFIARNYASPEPSWGAWGGEEIPTPLFAVRQVLHVPEITEARATELVSPSQILYLYQTAEARATDLITLAQILRSYQTAEVKATDIITSRQLLHIYKLAEAKADSLLEPLGWLTLIRAEAMAEEIINLKQVLHLPIAAEAMATDLISLSQLLYLYLPTEAKATDLVAPSQLLHIYKTADAKATDLFSLAQLLYLYPVAEAKARDVLEPLGWIVPLSAEVRATDIALPLQALLLYPFAEARAEAPLAYGLGLKQLAEAKADSLLEPLGWIIRQLAEAKATDLVSPAQLLHLYLPAEAKATDLVAPSQLLRIYKTADTRVSDLFTTRQVFRISELADVRATDLFEVKKGITALFTAAVKANAPMTLRQLIRAYLIASAKVSAPKTGKRKHPDHYMPTICLWYFDLDTGEVLPETFE